MFGLGEGAQIVQEGGLFMRIFVMCLVALVLKRSK